MLGIGATLINDNKIIVFPSKRLTDAESHYANIERELLAVIFGCKRLHTCIHTYMEKNSKSNLTINPFKISKIKTLHKHPQDYKGCCLGYNHMMQR